MTYFALNAHKELLKLPTLNSTNCLCPLLLELHAVLTRCRLQSSNQARSVQSPTASNNEVTHRLWLWGVKVIPVQSATTTIYMFTDLLLISRLYIHNLKV